MVGLICTFSAISPWLRMQKWSACSLRPAPAVLIMLVRYYSKRHDTCPSCRFRSYCSLCFLQLAMVGLICTFSAISPWLRMQKRRACSLRPAPAVLIMLVRYYSKRHDTCPSCRFRSYCSLCFLQLAMVGLICTFSAISPWLRMQKWRACSLRPAPAVLIMLVRYYSKRHDTCPSCRFRSYCSLCFLQLAMVGLICTFSAISPWLRMQKRRACSLRPAPAVLIMLVRYYSKRHDTCPSCRFRSYCSLCFLQLAMVGLICTFSAISPWLRMQKWRACSLRPAPAVLIMLVRYYSKRHDTCPSCRFRSYCSLCFLQLAMVRLICTFSAISPWLRMQKRRACSLRPAPAVLIMLVRYYSKRHDTCPSCRFRSYCSLCFLQLAMVGLICTFSAISPWFCMQKWNACSLLTLPLAAWFVRGGYKHPCSLGSHAFRATGRAPNASDAFFNTLITTIHHPLTLNQTWDGWEVGVVWGVIITLNQATFSQHSEIIIIRFNKCKNHVSYQRSMAADLLCLGYCNGRRER